MPSPEKSDCGKVTIPANRNCPIEIYLPLVCAEQCYCLFLTAPDVARTFCGVCGLGGRRSRVTCYVRPLA
jgi:hypothetical protein